MPLSHTVSITLDIYGIIICVALLAGLWNNVAGQKNLKHIYQWMCWFNIGTLLGDIPNWLCEGLSHPWYPLLLRSGCFLLYMSGILLLLMYTRYVACYLACEVKVRKSIVYAVWVIAGIYILCLALSQFNGMFYYIDSANIYHRGDWYVVSQVMGMSILLIDTMMVFAYRKYLRKKELAAFGGYIILPIIAGAVQFFFYGLSLTYTASTIELLIIYIHIQSRQELLIEQMEKKLLKVRISMLMGQIRPHFLFNTLTAIAGLCTVDGKLAKKELINFATYLRSNMNSLSKDGLISFEEEIRHTKLYLSMEKLRFGRRLRVVYKPGPVHFPVPPLTLQPIVENAVRHGITKCEEGGTIRIITEESQSEWLIIVEDDGPGFDISDTSLCDGIHHVGIYNVRQRLESLCSGSLQLYKREERGIQVVIHLPKGVTTDEDDSNR